MRTKRLRQEQRGHPGQSIGQDHGTRGPRGWDGAKKLSGRKRHLLVDLGGLVLTVVVHPADISDRDGARLALEGITQRFPRLRQLWVDAGYRGATLGWIEQHLGLRVIVPRRWMVGRSFAWLGRSRRLSKDYEALPASEEAWIHLASSMLMLARWGDRTSGGGCSISWR